MKELGNHAAASEKLLEALADRTFSDVSGEDLEEVNRRQAALVTRLWRLNQKMKDRKLQHKISKNPSLFVLRKSFHSLIASSTIIISQNQRSPARDLFWFLLLS